MQCFDLQTGNRGPTLFQQPRGSPNLFFSDTRPSPLFLEIHAPRFIPAHLIHALVFKFPPKRAANSASTKFKLHATQATRQHYPPRQLTPFLLLSLVGELNCGYLLIFFQLLVLIKYDVIFSLFPPTLLDGAHII